VTTEPTPPFSSPLADTHVPGSRHAVLFLASSIAAAALLVVIASVWPRPGPPPPPYSVGRVTALTTAPGLELDPALSPDGKRILFQAGYRERQETSDVPGGTIYTDPALGGTPRPLVQATRSAEAFAPDGRWVAYIWGGALHLIAPDGSGHRVLVTPPDPAVRPAPAMPAWSPDSRAVYYMAYDEERRGSIWSIAVNGGTPKLLVRFDDPTRPSLRRDFATDGKRLYFAIAEPASDISLMELDSR